ncbi:MAG: SRPBCC family protein [Solirubrobacteraceae bacterium]
MTEYGELEQTRDGRWQLRFERRLSHGVETVWRAVTEPEHLAAWFPTTVDGERAAGARLRFTFPGGEAEPMDGVMLAFDPMSLMELQWGPDTVRIELEPVSSGTLLRLLAVLEDRGKGARDGAGWHTCLDALGSHLDGASAETARTEMDSWKHAHTHYLDAFGPQAATIGPPEGFE